MEWISVEDRLPEKSGEYLAFWEWGKDGWQEEGVCCQVSRFNKDFWDYGDTWGSGLNNNGYVTHWSPLPKPPNKEI
jgi:hypothetical protein